MLRDVIRNLSSKRRKWLFIGGAGLVVVVVVIVVVLILGRGDEAPSGPGGTPDQCKQQLNYLRTYMQNYCAQHGCYPEALVPLDVVGTPKYYRCPVSDAHYIYDPRGGRLFCPYEPHMDF